MSVHPHGDLDNPGTVHEESDINVRAIIWFMVVLTVIVLAVDVAMYGLFELLKRMEEKNDPVVSPLALPAGQPLGPPGLPTEPWTDLKKFRAEQLTHLHGYGWVDQPGGIARIPIDQAKALLLKKGLPVRPELADVLEGTSTASGGESNGGRTIPAGQPDKSSPVAPPAAAPAKPGGGGHDD
jgi:hypothetical protein